MDCDMTQQDKVHVFSSYSCFPFSLGAVLHDVIGDDRFIDGRTNFG